MTQNKIITLQKILPFVTEAGLILILLLIFSCSKDQTTEPPDTVAKDTLALLKEFIKSPQECAACHPNHYNEWQQSMHAYAVHDPVFIKLNRLGQQRSGNQLDQFCVKCHAPAGSALQETPPDFELANLSEIAARGVVCDVCHKVDFQNTFRGTGITHFTLDRVRRGPISDPVENSFHESQFSNAYNFSGFCAPCHDLESPDGTFLLETTNTEWDNSAFAGMGVECQDCHMPSYSGQAALGGPQRDNLHRHTFVGVDYPLVDFPGKAETIAAVRNLLENSVSMTVTSPANISPGSSFQIDIRLKNDRVGHDIPSGSTFERQMWIELLVGDSQNNQQIFATGLLDPNGDLLNHHSEYVQDNRLPADTSLVLFRGIPKDENGVEIPFFWEAASVELVSIEAFKSHTSSFTIQAPASPTSLNVSARLRFRSFPPYFLREIDEADLISELLIFDMAADQHLITVQ